jgi:hypothetical protein
MKASSGATGKMEYGKNGFSGKTVFHPFLPKVDLGKA